VPTHVQLRTIVYDFLGADTGRISAANVTHFLNIAQRELCERDDLPFAEGTTTTLMSLDTRAAAVPSNFSRPWVLQYVDPDDGESWITLQQRDHDWILTNYGPLDTQSSGKPQYYSVFDDSFQLAPTPNFAGVSLQVAYYKILTDLSADGDTNDLTNRWWPLLVYKTLALMSAVLLEDDRIDLWETAFQRELNRIRSETNRRLVAGSEVQAMREPG
jgi:hypothetical protein